MKRATLHRKQEREIGSADRRATAIKTEGQSLGDQLCRDLRQKCDKQPQTNQQRHPRHGQQWQVQLGVYIAI